MLPESRSYQEICRQFRWRVPPQFNIGVEVCDRWAARDPDKLALIAVDADGRARDVTYGWLRETSNRLANVLRRTASAAATGLRSCCRRRPKWRRSTSRSTSSAPWRCRSRSCSGRGALAYRLQNSGAKALITNAQGLAKLAKIARCAASA